MDIYYYSKPDKKKWSGDVYGAIEKAQELVSFSEPDPLNNSSVGYKEKKIKGKIVVKGTNIEDLLGQIKKLPNQFNLDKTTFIVGGNQTQKTLQFITEIRALNKKIEADVMPGTLDNESELKYTDKNTKISITYNAITGTKSKNVQKSLFEKDLMREFFTLEQKINTPLVTVHWGGAVGGEGISNQEQEIHKEALISKLQEIRETQPELQIIFVPHGMRSFLPQKDSDTTQAERKKNYKYSKS